MFNRGPSINFVNTFPLIKKCYYCTRFINVQVGIIFIQISAVNPNTMP